MNYSHYSQLLLWLHLYGCRFAQNLKACTTAVFPWVNAIYGLSNQLTFRSYAYYAFQIYVFIIDCISGEMFILVTMCIISFGATKFFLTRIKTYSYGPVTIVGEGAFSCIIPQGIIEIVLFLGEQFVPWRTWICLESWIWWSNQQNLNSWKKTVSNELFASRRTVGFGIQPSAMKLLKDL